MITGTQVRAARALLGWSQQRLAEAADVSLPTIKRVELRANELAGRVRTVEKIRAAVEAAGVVLIDDDQHGGHGVRLAKGDGA